MSAIGIRAGRASVEIGLHDKYSAGLKAAQQKLRSFANGVQSLGLSAGKMGVAIGIPMAAATMQFARFDDAMRAVGAVTRANEADLKSMTDTAAELGRTTSFTSVEVANLMTELGRAGFSPTQINEMTAAVLDLSRATGTDAAMSAGIVASTLRQFKLEAAESARVCDVLTLAANATFNTVEGLGESLKYAGPVASQLNMSLEETVAILGALGNVGIQGSEAGTALRRLSVLAAAAGNDLKRIFNVDNVDAAGTFKPLTKIMEEIGKSIAHLPVVVQVEKMNEAFGLLGITASSVLSGAALEVTALEAQLKEAAGTAAKAAADMDAGIGGSFRRLLSALEGLQNAIGKAVEGPITNAAEVFGRLIGEVTAWVQQNQTAVVSVVALGSALLGTGAALIALGVAAKVVAVGIGGLLATIKAATLAISAFKVATLAFGVTAAATSGNIAGLRAAAAGLASLKTVNPAAAAGLRSMFKMFAGGAAGVEASAGTMSKSFSAMLVPLLPFIAKALLVVAAVTAVAAVIGVAANRAGLFATAWEHAKKVMSNLLDVAQQTFGGIATALRAGQYLQAVKVLWAGVKAAFWTGMEGYADAWSIVFDNLLDNTVAFGKSLLSTLWDVFKAIPKMLWTALRGGASLGQQLADALTGGTQGIGDAIRSRAANSRQALKELNDQTQAQADAYAKLKKEEEALQKIANERKQAEDSRAATEAIYAEAKQVLGPNASTADIGYFADARGALGKDASVDSVRKYMQDLARVSELNGVIDEEKDQASAIEAMKKRVTALQDETLVLKHGEAAAERLKLAQQAASDSSGQLTEQLAAFDQAAAENAQAQGEAAIRERIAALNEEIIAIRNGNNAAERYRLSVMGIASEQIAAVAAMQRAVDGASLVEAMKTPLELFHQEMAKVKQLAAEGLIDPETARRASEKAKSDLQGAADTDAKRQELYRSEQRRIQQLIDAGKLSTEIAARHMSATAALLEEAKARAQGAGAMLTKLTNAGTFSGFAAGRMSSVGNRSEKLQEGILVETKEQNKKLERQIKALANLRQVYG